MRELIKISNLFQLVIIIALLNNCSGSPKDMFNEELPEYMQFGKDPKGKIVKKYKVGQPYQVSGIWHYPSEDFGYKKTGIASWYGPGFHGKRTANGEKYDMNALTAAHKTLPMPSIVKVTNLANKKTIKVRINDRGPFIEGRIIDLSKKAAELLEIDKLGTARVRVELIPDDSMTLKTMALDSSGAFNKVKMPEIQTAPLASIVTEEVKPLAEAYINNQEPMNITRKFDPSQITRQLKPLPETNNVPLQTTSIQQIMKPGFYVQAGAFSEISNAKRLEAQISHLGSVFINVANIAGQTFHRVRLGPFVERSNAERLLDYIRNSGYSGARIFAE